MEIKSNLLEATWWCLGKLGALAMLSLLICLSPFLIIYMWLDFKQLMRSATAIEPMHPDATPNAIGRVIIFLTLPFIVLIGIVLALFSSSNDNDEVTW